MACLLVVLLVAGACGVPQDEAPRLLARDDLPQGLRPGQLPTSAPELQVTDGALSDQQVFMIGPGNKVQGVFRQISEDPLELLEILLLGTSPEEAALGVTTTFTRDTRVQDVQINELFRLATVDLAPGSLDARRNEQKLGFAQIVYTLTSLEGIETVQFVQTDPTDPGRGAASLSVQTDTGTTLPGQRVSRENFALLDPDIGPVIAFEPDIPTPAPTAPEIDPDQGPLFDLAIWKLNEQSELVKVSRRTERTQEALLLSLFDGTLVDGSDENIRSAIPPDALFNGIETGVYELVRVDAAGVETTTITNIATVDLAEGSLPPTDEGNERLLATAQIVFTLTELVEIDQVVLSVEGLLIPMLTPAGLTLPFSIENPVGLSRDDFAALLPIDGQLLATPVPVLSPTPGPAGDDAPSTEPAETTPLDDAVVPEPTPTPTPGS